MFKGSSPPVVMIRNVVGSFRPMHRDMGYRGGIWLRRLVRRCRVWMSIGLRTFGGVAILWTSTLRANPVGEQVVGGAATFNRPDAATLLINQQTDRAVINWSNFSISHGELTHFVQPSSTSATLNRVVTLSPSLIDGALRANGQVWLSNPNGIMVGKGGTVNVGSFLATTHGIQTDDFMRGGDVNLQSQSDAAILNQGKIEARDGDVFLVAKEVKNEGQLMARDGTVGMVSGTEVSLQSVGAGKYKVRLLADESGNGAGKSASDSAELINEGVIEAANAVLEATGSYLPLAIRNDGTIRATSAQANSDGSVSLLGGKGDVVNRGVVEALCENLSGKKEGGDILVAGKNIITDSASILTASGEEKGGEVRIEATNILNVRGKVEATSSGGSGGKVVVTGERIALLKAEVDASGAVAGGQVLVGGDLSGANPEVRNSSALFMSPDSVIRADATQNGNGGEVVLWSDQYTGFYGNIFARGGLKGGDGGFVETSSALNLQVDGQVDVSAAAGRGGTWLMDPPDLYIGTANGGVSVIYTDSATTAAGYYPAQTPPLVDFSVSSGEQNAQVKVDRILFALNNNQNVIIRAGPKIPEFYNWTGSGVGNGNGDIVVATPIIASTSSTGSLTLVNNYLFADGNAYGSIRVNEQIVVGGDLTMIAANNAGVRRSPPPASNPWYSDGGTGGSVFINAPLFANGRVTLTAGLSLASASGGKGGDVIIKSDIYAGKGVDISGGDADKSWTALSTFSTGGSLYWTTANRTWPKQTQTAGSNPSNLSIQRAFGGTGGTVNIAKNVTIYIGNGDSQIRSGNAGQNAQGGDLVIDSTILALGNRVNLNLKSGQGVQSGNLTTSVVLGQSGISVSAVNGVALPSTAVSQIFNELGFWAGNLLTVGDAAYANTINVRPLNPAQSYWINQNDITGLFASQVKASSIANLFSTTLNIGALEQDIDPTTSTFISAGSTYVIRNLGSATTGTTQDWWNTAAGTTGLTYKVGDLIVVTDDTVNGSYIVSSTFLATNPTAIVKQAAGDIGIGQAGPVNFNQGIVNFSGYRSAVDFDSSSGSAYCISLPSGGVVSFNTGGPVFSNFGGATADIYIPNGTVNFNDVQAPGNNPVAAPGTGTIYLDVAQITGAQIYGNAYLQIVQTSGSVNSGNLSLGSMVITPSPFNQGNVLGIPMAGNLSLVVPDKITQTGPLSVAGTTSITSGGSVTLDIVTPNNRSNSFGGAVSLNTSGAATIRATGNLSFGTVSVPSLTAISSGNITQSSALTISGTSSFTSTGGTSTGGSINLSNSGNDFVGAVNLTTSGTGNISIRDANSLNIGGISMSTSSSGTLTFTVGSALSQSGVINTGTGGVTISATGANTDISLASFANAIQAGSITFTNPSNIRDYGIRTTFASADADAGLGGVSLPNLRNLTVLYDNAAINLPALSLATSGGQAGSLVLSSGAAGGVSQTGAFSVPGSTSVTATAGAITLTNSNNDFVGAVTLAGSGSGPISITDKNSLIIGGITQPGAGIVTLTVGNGLTQTGLITTGTSNSVGGAFRVDTTSLATINLSTQNNLIRSGAITLLTPGNVQNYYFRNTYSGADPDAGLVGGLLTSLENLSIFYGTLAGVGTSALNLPAVTLRNGGNMVLLGTSVNQAGAFTVSGSTTVTATTGGITLTNANNDFTGAVSLTTYGNNNISVVDKNALLLGDIRMGTTGSGQLSLVTTAGSITQSGRTTVSTGRGAVTVTAGGGSAITLNNDNDFRGAVSLTGGTTQIRDINNLTLGLLSTGSLTATSFGDLNLGYGTVNGNLTATSNDGNISQTAGITMGASSFNAGKGSVTMTAGVNGIPSNVYLGNIALRASSADFLVAQVNGVERLGQYAGSTVVTGKFTVRSPRDVLFNLSNGAGGFELTAGQLNNMNLGTLETRASGTGNLAVGTFNAPTIDGLNLVTEGTGNITAGSITVGTLGIDSGGTMTFARVGGLQNNRVRNLSNVRISVGGFSFQNRIGLNLVGTLAMPGRTEMEIAGQFYNRTGIKSPLAGVQQGSVIKSLSLFGGFPQVSGLAGFNYRYDGVMPSAGNWMSYAVLPIAMYAPSGTVIAGVDLSGTPTGGGQLNTFFTGSNNLNWIISDFGKFNLPEVNPARLEYMLYPQRVEPETRTLPLPTIQTLTRELGRPPTAEEVNQRLASLEAKERQKDGVLFEKSSFDEEGAMPFEEARIPDQVMDGGKPQAGTDNPGIEPVLPCPSDSLSSQDKGVHLLAQQRVDTKKDPTSPMLKGVSKRAVALRDELGDTENLIKSEREQAEVNLSEPVAGNR